MSIWGKILDNKLTRLAEKSVLHSAYRRSHDEVALERTMRGRDAISVEFLINSLSAWKTEKLYEAMAAHPRFRPSISIPPSLDEADTRALRQYLTAKGYKFRDMAAYDKINADIAFYQKPYAIFTERGGYAYWRNADTLTCYIDYAFHTTETKWGLNLPFLNEAWMVFYENQTCVDGAAKIMDNGARNSVVTGLPVQDELMAGAEGEADPWKPQPTVKKRVIYAPHHSIEDDGGLNFSTFMEMGEDMLKIAEQHADTMQFAFKPHPLLRPKLEKAWGRERTDEYYSKWAELPNCQMEEGKYNALFMKSDALIHDCSSFIVGKRGDTRIDREGGEVPHARGRSGAARKRAQENRRRTGKLRPDLVSRHIQHRGQGQGDCALHRQSCRIYARHRDRVRTVAWDGEKHARSGI